MRIRTLVAMRIRTLVENDISEQRTVCCFWRAISRMLRFEGGHSVIFSLSKRHFGSFFRD
jgi:hypothetical protein